MDIGEEFVTLIKFSPKQANLTKETLTKMHTGQNFDHFYLYVARKSEGRAYHHFQESDALWPDWRLVLVH